MLTNINPHHSYVSITPDQEELPGIKCNIRELDEVLMRDVGNRIKDSGKWPMIIDTTGQASTFVRYRDTNYVCALNPKDVEEERMRMSLIGAIRYHSSIEQGNGYVAKSASYDSKRLPHYQA